MLVEKSQTVGDLTLKYVETGSGDPLVLLHGFSGNWRSWSQEIDILSHRWRVIAPSFRGHGGSSASPDGEYGYNVRVADAAAFIKSVSDEPVVLGGHSMGGATATGVAALHPELVRALFLEDPHVQVDFVETIPPLIRTRELLRRGPSFTDLLSQIQGEIPSANATAARLSAAKQILMDPEAYTSFVEETLYDRFDPNTVLADIKCPSLLMQADPELSGIVSDEVASHMQQLVPDCTHVKFSGTGHNIHQDASVEFRRTLFDFLDTI
jgi:pimeloyl-ACP methyl ester carboxylesterase